jgi:hypothetical protein
VKVLVRLPALAAIAAALVTSCSRSGGSPSASAVSAPSRPHITESARAPGAQTSTPVLAGTLFKLAANGTGPTPVQNATVYIAQVTPSGPWFGPAITDLYGRYVLYSLPSGPGNYLMRMYWGTEHLWEQTVTLPGIRPLTTVIRDVRVVYFPTARNRTQVVNVLQSVQLPYDPAKEITSAGTCAVNGLCFGNNIALGDLKAVAVALISHKILIESVCPFRSAEAWMPKVVLIGLPGRQATAGLTVSDVKNVGRIPKYCLAAKSSR